MFRILLAMAGVILAFYLYTQHLESELEDSQKTVRDERNIHKVKLFENNQSIIFKKEKEVRDGEIPDSIGTHTVNINDDWMQ